MQNETESTYYDARLLTPYNPGEAHYLTQTALTIAPNKDSKNWKRDLKTPDVASLIKHLAQHPEAKNKDGLGFVPGDMLPGRRLDSAVREIHTAVLDCDLDPNLDGVGVAMVKSGKLCLCYTTYTHLKTTTEIKREDLTKFAPGEHDSELARRYLAEKRNWPARLTDTVEVEGTEHRPEGIMVIVRHKPITKCRIVFPLKTPFVVKDYPTLAAAKDAWRKIYFAVAESMGLAEQIDRTGADLNRFFYHPRHAPGAEHVTMLCGGDLLDWRELDTSNPYLDEANEIDGKGKSKSGRSRTDAGRDLGKWSRKYAQGFQIADVIRDHAPERIRADKGDKIEIECPNDAAHSNAGDSSDTACMAVNAGDGPAPVFSSKCHHASCRDLTNLDMLGMMRAAGWFPASVLTDPAYNAEAEGGDATPSPDTDKQESKSESAKKIEREDKAKEIYQEAIDSLTESSSDDAIEEAISCCIDANLGIRSFDAAMKRLSEQTKTPLAVVRKLVKIISADMRAASEGKKEDHGLDIFAYSGEFNFDDGVKKCVRVLKSANEKAELPLFAQSEGTPVRYEEKNGRVEFIPMNWTDLWSELNERIAFVRKSEQAESARQMVPKEVATQFHAQARKHLPMAPEVFYTPVYNADGVLLVTPGYWPENNHILVDTGLGDLEVSENPTREEAEASRDWILENLLGDFPFCDTDEDTGEDRRDISEANALAYLLTPFMRRMIRGNTPLFMIVKPQPDAGASFLAELGMKLFGGMESTTAPINYTGNPEEMEKKIVSGVQDLRSHFYFDNVREFNNQVLLASLTSKVIGGRVLGKSMNLHRPNNVIWVATGIAPKVGGEMHRRSCWIRLNLKQPRGAKRKYRHKNFDAFLEENRGLAIHHVLTMIEFWDSQNAPGFKGRELSSFEDWSRKVGGVLETCGVKGFLESPAPVILDPESASDDAFLRTMHDKFNDRYASVTDLFEWAGPDGAELAIAMTGHPEERQRNFAEALGRLNGVTFVSKDKESYQLRAKNDDTDGVVFGIVPVKTKVPA